jgi:hypothetical protein
MGDDDMAKQTYSKRHVLITYARIITISQIALLIILALFQSIWVFGGSETSIMNQSGLQRFRASNIKADVLILAYRPTQEHPQAISDLQNILPAWEQTQAGLRSGSTALQLPSTVPESIQQALIPAQSDFVAIDSAARIILAHADGLVDPIQLQIILDHERQYRIEMSQVVTLWQQQIDGAFLHIYYWEMGLTLAMIVLVVGKYLFVTSSIFKAMEQT